MEERVQVLSAGIEALNALDVGVVLLRAPVEVIFANQSAERVFRRADGLSVRAGSLRASDASSDAALHAAVRVATATEPSLTAPGAIHVARIESQRPYQLVVTPLPQGTETMKGLPTPHVMVVIADPDRARAVPRQSLESLYGLTPREAALAAALTEGATLKEAARALGMMYETARSHLRRVFEKTGTCRQSELITRLGELLTTRVARID